MPLYQPSNITPSSFAGVGGGTVAAADPVRVTWQVNGNTPLTAFQIDIYTGDTESTLVHSTGILSSGYGLPHYGTDTAGNPVFFSFAPNETYADYGLSDGNHYKLKITQYWNGETTPDYSVVQFSESAFITRTAPTLSIADFGGAVDTVAKTFTAAYAQAQGDAINFVRWRLTDTTTNALVSDTGMIRTALLSFTHKGFINSHSYTLSCEVETENGATALQSVSFSCTYAQQPTSNELSVARAQNGRLLLQWGSDVNIHGVVSSPTGYYITGEPLTLNEGETVTWQTVGEDAMHFAPPYTISWRGKIPPAYTAGTPSEDGTEARYAIQKVCYNKDGSKIAVSLLKNGNPHVYVYALQGNSLTKIADIVPAYSAYGIAWSPDGSMLVLGGGIDRYSDKYAFLRVYSVTDSGATLLSKINASENGLYTALCFSADGSRLFAARAAYTSSSAYKTKTSIYTVNGTEFTLAAEHFDGSTYQKNKIVTVGMYYANDSLFCICTELYSRDTQWVSRSLVNGTTVTLAWSRLYDQNISPLDADVSEDGQLLYLLSEYRESSGISSTRTVKAEILDATRPDSVLQVIPLSDKETNIRISADKRTLGIGNRLYCFEEKNNLYAFLGAVRTKSGTTWSSATYLSPNENHLISFSYGINGFSTLPYFRTEQTLFSFGDCTTVQQGLYAVLQKDGDSIGYVPLYQSADTVILSITATDGTKSPTFRVITLDFAENEIWDRRYATLSENPADIPSAVLYGAQVCEYLHIGTSDPFIGSLVPKWDGNTLFYARFADGLQAGTISASGSTSMAFYREENGALLPLLRVPTSITTMMDFGVKSGDNVKYIGYFTDGDTYSAPITLADSVLLKTVSYYLYECTKDENDSRVYHVLNIYRFGNNAESGTVSNNNAPNFLENFTKYPVRQFSSQMPKSGTLSAMLSNATDTGYADSAEQMERLYNLSDSANTFFLKDRKGNLYMVGIDGAITQTVNDASAAQEVSISIPWREIGDANDAVIIQLPTDAGWNRDEQNGGADALARIAETEVSITENKTTVILPPKGAAALSKVTVKTNVQTDLPSAEEATF